MPDETTTRIYTRIDDHETRLVRVETRIEDAERRLEIVEGMPKQLNHVRSSVDMMRGQLVVLQWLLFALAMGVIASGFALFRHGA